jgi:hypothetical protein
MKWHSTLTILCVGALAQPAAAEEIALPLAVHGPGMASRFHAALPWTPVERSHELRIGEHLSCRSGCTVRMNEGTEVFLAPGSEIEGASPVFHRFPGEPMATKCLAVHVVAGSVRVRRHAPRHPLIVTTSAGVTTAVHDGDADVRALADRAAMVLHRGSASAKLARGWRSVASGQAHSVSASGFLSSRPIVTTPVWRDEGEFHRPLALAAHDPQGRVAVSWQPVPGASR